jgi:hypothetical protein
MGRKDRRLAKLIASLPPSLRGEASSDIELGGPEVDFFFADDSRQNAPTRPGMGPLLAIGGINVPAESVSLLLRHLDVLCAGVGMPPNQEFKWSPGKELWMRNQLTGNKREDFFFSILNALASAEATATVVIVDMSSQPASSAGSPEIDATNLFLERVEAQCGRGRSEGFVVVDRPSGSRADEDAFLASCLETLQSGTQYVKPQRIAHSVLSTPSKLSRLIQAADLITGSTLAYVSGEATFSPAIFQRILPLLDRSTDRIGGFGLKIHPDHKYANLYHWLVGDTIFKGASLPSGSHSYAIDPLQK